MAALEDLPADQRAVLQLVLGRGRSYDDIASMLSIDRAAVRQRALAALDALGPRTAVEPMRRALITDYLMGQLPARLAADVRDHLADSPPERAWARIVAAELTQVASRPLPEIPVEGSRRGRGPQVDAPSSALAEGALAEASGAGVAPLTPRGVSPTPRPAHRVPASEPAATAPSGAGVDAETAAPRGDRPSRRTRGSGAGGAVTAGAAGPRRSSRLGGAILLALAVAVIVVAIVLIVSGGGGSSHKTTSTAASNGASTTGTKTGSTSTSTTATKVIGRLNLKPPSSSSSSKAAGIAEILQQGSVTGIAIVAQHLAPNTGHDAYAVWLYNSPTDVDRLGFVTPGVTSTGQLRTEGQLPANASHYKQVLITLETTANPKTPGAIVLQGAFKVP